MVMHRAPVRATTRGLIAGALLAVSLLPSSAQGSTSRVALSGRWHVLGQFTERTVVGFLAGASCVENITGTMTLAVERDGTYSGSENLTISGNVRDSSPACGEQRVRASTFTKPVRLTVSAGRVVIASGLVGIGASGLITRGVSTHPVTRLRGRQVFATDDHATLVLRRCDPSRQNCRVDFLTAIDYVRAT